MAYFNSKEKPLRLGLSDIKQKSIIEDEKSGKKSKIEIGITSDSEYSVYNPSNTSKYDENIIINTNINAPGGRMVLNIPVSEFVIPMNTMLEVSEKVTASRQIEAAQLRKGFEGPGTPYPYNFFTRGILKYSGTGISSSYKDLPGNPLQGKIHIRIRLNPYYAQLLNREYYDAGYVRYAWVKTSGHTPSYGFSNFLFEEKTFPEGYSSVFDYSFDTTKGLEEIRDLPDTFKDTFNNKWIMSNQVDSRGENVDSPKEYNSKFHPSFMYMPDLYNEIEDFYSLGLNEGDMAKLVSMGMSEGQAIDLFAWCNEIRAKFPIEAAEYFWNVFLSEHGNMLVKNINESTDNPALLQWLAKRTPLMGGMGLIAKDIQDMYDRIVSDFGQVPDVIISEIANQLKDIIEIISFNEISAFNYSKFAYAKVGMSPDALINEAINQKIERQKNRDSIAESILSIVGAALTFSPFAGIGIMLTTAIQYSNYREITRQREQIKDQTEQMEEEWEEVKEIQQTTEPLPEDGNKPQVGKYLGYTAMGGALIYGLIEAFD